MASKVTLSLGLITIPARLEKATETTESMKTLCVGQNGKTHDPQPVHMPKSCDTCGQITDYAGLKKGVASGNGYVVVEQEEIQQIKAETVEQFKGRIDLIPHDAAEFMAATAQGEKLNYLTPDGASADHYRLIATLVESHPELAFVSMYTPRSRAGLYLARVREGVLVLEERTLHENLRPVPSVGGEVNAKLLAQFEAILSTLVEEFAPDTYTDNYAAAVAALTKDREEVLVADKPGRATPAAQPTDDDLMAQLTKLAAAQAKKPTKKAAAKKAKKVAA